MIAGIRPWDRSRRTNRDPVPLFFAGSLDSTAILTASAINRLCLTPPRGHQRSEAEGGRARRDPAPATPREKLPEIKKRSSGPRIERLCRSGGRGSRALAGVFRRTG